MMNYLWLASGFITIALGIALDDIRQRKHNQQLRERLSSLNEELEAADEQSAAYIETIARERKGKSCSKGCGKCG